ncbi:hypothetical protein WJX73_006182 [Symbiochloris irregularis]|uniref:Uncharacterized protein n=1 Tax=Symbiochloris irregularis TaxID=706552 RepID=A0AAW1PER2_9CHLO
MRTSSLFGLGQRRSRQPGPRRKRRSWTAFAFAVLLFVVLCGYAGLFALRYWLEQTQQHVRTQDPTRTCRQRLMSLGLVDSLGQGQKESHVINTVARRRLYGDMASQLHSQGLLIGDDAVLTQGLRAQDLFKRHGDHVQAVLHPLNIPVRAIVMPLLDPAPASALKDALHSHVLPIMGADAIWVQDETMFHTTLFHASSFQHAVPASAAQIAAEVLQGSDTVAIRRALQAALPGRAQQAVTQPTILHTTLARLLQPPLPQDPADHGVVSVK